MATNMSPKIFLNIIVSLICLLSSASNFAQGIEGEKLNELRSGKLRLSLSLFTSVHTGQDETKKLLDEGKWTELAANVIGKKHELDLYYYLLGRAAEGLGSPEAAGIYYGIAMQGKYNCSAYIFGDGCLGIRVSEAARERKLGLSIITRGKTKVWVLGEGPAISDYVSLKPTDIKDLLKRNIGTANAKGKFETNEEYAARVTSSADGVLVVGKIRTDNEKTCKTSYSHDKQKYIINGCEIYSPNYSYLEYSQKGEPFRLANLVDSREIQRIQNLKFFLETSFIWKSEFSISREEAAKLDSDMMAGIIISDYLKTSSCDECDRRETNEAITSTIKSIAALSNRQTSTLEADWKTEAFREGAIVETWVHKFTPKKVSKIVIFRRSDSRVIYEFVPE